MWSIRDLHLEYLISNKLPGNPRVAGLQTQFPKAWWKLCGPLTGWGWKYRNRGEDWKPADSKGKAAAAGVALSHTFAISVWQPPQPQLSFLWSQTPSWVWFLNSTKLHIYPYNTPSNTAGLWFCVQVSLRQKTRPPRWGWGRGKRIKGDLEVETTWDGASSPVRSLKCFLIITVRLT